MNFDDVAANLSPQLYARLKEAVELGKWPNGQALSREQKALCLEALLTYEVRAGVPEDERIGYIERPDCATPAEDEWQTIRMPGEGETLQ